MESFEGQVTFNVAIDHFESSGRVRMALSAEMCTEYKFVCAANTDIARE